MSVDVGVGVGGGGCEEMDGLAVAYERLAVRFNQLEAAYNQLQRPAASALPACLRAADDATVAAGDGHADCGETAEAAAAALASASTVSKKRRSPASSSSNKPVALLLEEIARLRERAEHAESLAAAWESQAEGTVNRLEALNCQLAELRAAAGTAGEDDSRACRLLEAGMADLRRLVEGQRALLGKLLLRESLRTRRPLAAGGAADAGPSSIGPDQPGQVNHPRNQYPHERQRALQAGAASADAIDFDDDNDNKASRQDEAADPSMSPSQYDNNDSWSRWMVAPSSSLLPRTDSLDHLREDDEFNDDNDACVGGASAAAAAAAAPHYNSVDDLHDDLVAHDDAAAAAAAGSLMETDDLLTRCPVCGMAMPPNGDLSAFNLHVNSHFADDDE